MSDLNLSKAIDAGAREMLLHDYPDLHGENIDQLGDPVNLAGYRNSFNAGFTAALPCILSALADEAMDDAYQPADGTEANADAWAARRWLRTKAKAAREARAARD